MVIIMITDPEIHSESTCCHLVIFTFLKSQSTFNENYLDSTHSIYTQYQINKADPSGHMV
jgi:hypothetical protein